MSNPTFAEPYHPEAVSSLKSTDTASSSTSAPSHVPTAPSNGHYVSTLVPPYPGYPINGSSYQPVNTKKRKHFNAVDEETARQASERCVA